MRNENKSDQVILAVDDVPENLRLLVQMLRHDYRLSIADNGEKALEIATSDSPPDLILLDINMPGIDGFEVCERLKADPLTRDIPVIFLTARDDEKDEMHGFELGAVDYVTKPFSAPVIKTRISTHLELQNQRRRLKSQARELSRTLDELDHRNRFIRQTFGRYLSDDIVNTILESPEGLKLGGEKREITILMSDIRGFTSISEKLPAEEVVDIINIYLEVMTDIILKYQGTIDEFIGDAILVLFGAPLGRGGESRRAVACALEMQKGMAEVNRRCRAKGYPELKQGIGINTGPVVVGNIGSKKRIKYAVVGNNVNLASRIQSYTLGGQIFISEKTMNNCGPILRIDDRVAVRPKGLNKPISIYEVGGIGGEHNIFLEKNEHIKLLELKHPIEVRYEVLTGNQIIEQEHFGAVTRLTETAAEITSNRSFRRMTNLKMSLYDPAGNEITTDLYSRVTRNISTSPPTFRADFTSVPAEAKRYFKSILEKSSA